MADPSRVRMSGPLEPFAPAFAAELGRAGFTANSARQQMGLVAHLSRWMVAESVTLATLDGDVVERFCLARRAAGYTNHLTPKALGHLLVHLRGLGVVAPAFVAPAEGPVEELLERFGMYLAVERGLADAVVTGYVHAVRPFVSGLCGPDGIDLGGLGGADVVAFIVERVPRQGSEGGADDGDGASVVAFVVAPGRSHRTTAG